MAITTESTHKIIINNKSFGELNGTILFLTDELHRKLEKEKTREGITQLQLFEQGRAVQGLKHLITIVRTQNNKSKIIFCSDKTRNEKGDYYINLDEYRKRSQAKFFSLYRERGLDTALSYLNGYFPTIFSYDPDKLKDSELKKVDKQLPEVLTTVSGKVRNKVAILEEASKTLSNIRSLKNKNKTLKYALQNIQEESILSFYRQSLDELRQRLTSTYHETRGKNSWQKWVYENRWLFGIQYLTPIQKEKIGFDNIPDFLFPTLDGFLDILEIKIPTFDVIREDPSHASSYAWCPDTNRAIGQVVNYIQNMELNQLLLKERINDKYGKQYPIPIQPLKPRAFILVGESSDWNSQKKKAFRTLNYAFHGIEIITYTDLIIRGESIISMFEK